MIVVDVVQGTQEWLNARLGIPTASCFGSIITPKKLQASSSRSYLYKLVAERLLGRPVDDASTDFMQRGSELEESAVSAYEFEHDCDTEKVGFVLHDSRRFGCSPDRFVGEDGLLEIKCKSAVHHVAALLGDEKEVTDDHMLQIQGQLAVTGKQWCDLFFYNPEMPCRTVRVGRNEAMISGMVEIIMQFCDSVDAAVARIDGSSAVVVEDSPAPPAAKPPKRKKREAVEEAPGNAGGTTPTPAAAEDAAPGADDEEPEPTEEQDAAAVLEAQLSEPDYLLGLCKDLEGRWRAKGSVIKPSPKDATKMWFTNVDMLKKIGSMASETLVQPLAFFQTTDPNKQLDKFKTYALSKLVIEELKACER